jgi:hypothetical protein
MMLLVSFQLRLHNQPPSARGKLPTLLLAAKVH